MEFLLVGLAVFFNIAFIKWKFDKSRYADATLDLTLLVIVMLLFSGSYGALVVGTIASAFISLFLYFSPPKFNI
jgi:hypothetical protein